MLAVGLLALASLPSQAAGPHDGVYGVVCFDPSKGDLNGTRMVLSSEAGKPVVVFQHCTPGCSQHQTVSARLTGDQLEFEIASRAKAAERARFSGRIRGNALILEGHTASYGFKRATLRKNQRCPRDTVLADP